MSGLMNASVLDMLGGTLATIAAYWVALRINRITGQHPLANPILIAAILLLTGLAVASLSVSGYMAGAEPLRWLLAPATVAFGLPIYRQRALILSAGKALIGAIIIGAAVGSISAVAMAKLLGLSMETVQALATKSITSPFAIALMERLGGPADLAAGLVIVTGLVGAILLPLCMGRTRENNPEAYALALGLAAHIVGNQHVARAVPQALSIASLALTIAGLATTVLLPLIWPWVIG